MTRRPSIAACWLAVTAAVALANPGDEAGPLKFFRVHVPHGKLADVDLGDERYVPMSAEEFSVGVARLLGHDRAAAGPTALAAVAETARYVAQLTASPRGDATAEPMLVGTAAWTMRDVGPSRSISLGSLRVGRASMRTAAGTGDAVVFGKPDGTLGIVTPEPGEYDCEWQCGPAGIDADAWVFRLPLVPALSTAIELRLPAGMRPFVTDIDTQPVAGEETAAGMNAWRIDVGPRRAVTVMVVPIDTDADTPGPRLRAWSDVSIRGREARIATLVEPVGGWRPRASGATGADGIRVRLAVPAEAIVTAVRLRDADTGREADAEWASDAEAAEIEVVVPPRSVGYQDAVIVEAVAPVAWEEFRPLPLVAVSASAWGGGGAVIRCDAGLVVSRIDTKASAVVPPEVASRWPGPTASTEADDTPAGGRPARIFIEHQAAMHAVRLAVAPRAPTVSISRLTVVDVAPGAVLGKATCELAVMRGEAFEVRGRLAKGWVLDAVEAVTPTDPLGEMPEWKVVRDGADDVVRVAFAAAVSARRGMTLRLSGHRAGVPPGIDVTSTDLDMVRLEGESDAAVLAVKTGPDMTIDLAGDEPLVPATDPALVGDTSIRVRLPAGVGAAERVMRLVRRRPPIDVRTHVRITTRDGRLTESFTFECTPQRSEIDAVVVHFSTVMDDRLEWSLLPPATGTLAARRIDSPDRREGRSGEPIADSWIVELSSPARETVTIRAATTVPFSGTTPVPLAWVEGAIRPAGVVSVREAGRLRPRIVNRRLEELPPAGDAGEQAGATVAEFGFDPARGRPDDPLPAAEIVPGGSGTGDDARAWAWREANAMWCHASGVIEFETRFELENHGRSSVMLSVPQTLRVQGVRVNGERVADGVSSSGGGEMTVELPVGQRFVEIVVQGLAVHDARIGIWPIAASAVSLDVPVLQRSNQLLLAPDVAVARVAGAYRVIDENPQVAAGWAERLLGASVRPMARRAAAAETPAPSAVLSPSGSVVEGYRMRTLVPVVGRRVGGSVWLVRRGLVEATMIVAAAVVFVVVMATSASRAWLIAWICGVTAVGALWAAVPFDAVFRAACWSAVAALVLRTSGMRFAPAVVMALIMPSLPSAAAEEPLRVYLTPIEAGGAAGETALVPEPLFRAIARASVAPANVRVVACTATARLWSLGDETAPAWKLSLDIEADAGGVFSFDPGATRGEVVGPQAILDGDPQPVQRAAEGSMVQVAVPTAGRHRLELSIQPTLVRRGDIEEAVAAMPCAAVGRLLLAAIDDTAAVVCEAAPPGGVFQLSARLADAGGDDVAFDISRAVAVRLSRPVDARLRLAAGPRAAISRNDVFWDLDACRVIATFDIDAGNEVVRSCVLETDPGLVPAGDDPALEPLGPHRYLLERSTPTRGRWTIQVPFRMPLADPVGVFAVPQVWIANPLADTRTTLLVPAPDLTVNVTLPDGVTSAPRDTDATLQGFSWQAEITAAPATREDRASQPSVRGRGQAVVMVERRQSRPRATQQLQMEFGVDQIRLGLQARIDATSTVLGDVQIDLPADCVIDRLELIEDRGLQVEAVDRGPLDVHWTRPTPENVLVVVQRPQSGRFRLDVEARLVGRPAARGALPVMRAALAGSVPMTVEWRTAAGRGACMRASYGEPLDVEQAFTAADRTATGAIELAGGETALFYEVGGIEPVVAAGPTVAAGETIVSAAARDSRVEWADVFLDVDGRGRVWGKARFDLVTETPTVRLSLPAGMRLFEVLVDGRAVVAAPQDDGTWLVSLFGVRWPRSVVAVFAGEVAAGQAAGAPFVMASPQLVGLPCRQVGWTLRVAPGLMVRVADAMQIVDEPAIAAARRAAADRLEDDFIRAVEECDPVERPRMTDFARLRRTGAELPIEEAWARSLTMAEDREVARVLAAEPATAAGWPTLVVRIERAADPTAASRAMATLGVIGACAGAWNLAARRPLGRRRQATWVLPLVVALAGVVWLLLFDPGWPGWALIAAAVMMVAMRPRDRVAAVVSDDSTITQFAPSATASSWTGASTRTFLARDE